MFMKGLEPMTIHATSSKHDAVNHLTTLARLPHCMLLFLLLEEALDDNIGNIINFVLIAKKLEFLGTLGRHFQSSKIGLTSEKFLVRDFCKVDKKLRVVHFKFSSCLTKLLFGNSPQCYFSNR